MTMPTPVKNAMDNWMQDYRDCGRDAINELVTKQLIKELAPNPREEFLQFVLEETIGAIPFGDQALKMVKFASIVQAMGEPPKGEEAAKLQEYMRKGLNDYKKKLRDELIKKANKDWDDLTSRGSTDDYIFLRHWFVETFKDPYRDIDDEQQDLEVKANALTKALKTDWRKKYENFKAELKRRQKENERKERCRRRRGGGGHHGGDGDSECSPGNNGQGGGRA